MLNWQRNERWCSYVRRRQARRATMVEQALQLAQNETSQRLALRLAHQLRVHVPQVGASPTAVGMKLPAL